MDIKDRFFNGLKYKYHPYPKFDCFEFAKNEIKFNFWFNRDYTGDKYYDGYPFMSRYCNISTYVSKALSLLETNFCFDEYVFFRDIVLDSLYGKMSYYDIKARTGIPHDKLYVLLADMNMMGEVEFNGCYVPEAKKPYQYSEVELVDYPIQYVVKDDYSLHVDEYFMPHFISTCGYYYFIR